MKRHSSRLADLLQSALEGRTPTDLTEQERKDVAPLINVAEQLRELPCLEPDPSAIVRCLARLEREEAPASRRVVRHARRSLVLAYAASFVVMMLIVGGVAVATAHSSLPGELLYPVKRASEDVRLFFTTNSAGRVEWCACLSQRRLDEFVAIAKSGTIRGKTLLAMQKANHCAQVAAERASDPKRDMLIAQVGQLCQAQGVVLQDMKGWIPVKDTALVNAAIAACARQCKACCICPSGTECEYDR